MDRKTLQLCSQVERVLALVLPADIVVHGVAPAQGASRLVVAVDVPGAKSIDDLQSALAHLERMRGRLRCEIAAAISRKRAPELTFVLAGPAAP